MFAINTKRGRVPSASSPYSSCYSLIMHFEGALEGTAKEREWRGTERRLKLERRAPSILPNIAQPLLVYHVLDTLSLSSTPPSQCAFPVVSEGERDSFA